jgi:crossover junction endodeoxyribonuclease RuvC
MGYPPTVPPMLVAVDPGLHGAIASLSSTGAITAVPMPLAGGALDLPAIAAIIRDTSPQWLILEKVASRPGQGVASTFKFGMGYGAVLGVAAAVGVPVELVTPQRWKGAILHGTAKDKAAAIAYCRRVYPKVNLVPPGCRVPHDGLADSLCLLEYGRRCLLPQAAPPGGGAIPSPRWRILP